MGEEIIDGGRRIISLKKKLGYRLLNEKQTPVPSNS